VTYFKVEREIFGQKWTLETGKMAKQADGAVLVTMGGTMVLSAVQSADPRPGIDFFPLTVDYRERTAAAGKFPGGFFKREGRPTQKEILTMRLTDRHIRPLFAEGKWQWRFRARYISTKADLNDDGHDDVDESGFGDSDMNFLTILNLDIETKTAWAGGLEVFMNAGENEVLGAGSTSLGPQIFYVMFLPTGLFAPALQYRFSIDEGNGCDQVDEYVLDLNYLRMAKDKKSWFFADPKLFYDHENDKKFSVIDLEWGWMMAN